QRDAVRALGRADRARRRAVDRPRPAGCRRRDRADHPGRPPPGVGSQPMSGIVLEDVVLTLGDGEEIVTALDHVDLRVEPGEIVAILGPSGSGKSSLLAVAGGLTSPDSGTVRIGDEELTGRSRRELTTLRRDLVGFVFQSGNLVPSLTAVDQLRLPGTFKRGRTTRDPRALLEEVGLGHRADRRPHQL